MKKILCIFSMLFCLVGFSSNASASSFADVAFVIDQSGSMSGEFSWLSSSITTIAQAISDAGITANYGLAGYEDTTGSEYYRNAWVNLTSDINDITAEANSVSTYGGTEEGYQAVDWALDNFSWNGGDYAKIVILITDEDSDHAESFTYNGLTGEAALADLVDDENVLLNVITSTTLYSVWDDAVYTSGSYAGIFDLNYLRTDAQGFTADFTSAKIKEIIDFTTPAPEPSSIILICAGLLGLASVERRRGFFKA